MAHHEISMEKKKRDYIKIFKDWVEMERRILKSTKNIRENTENKIIRLMLLEIELDTKKHIKMLEEVKNLVLEGEALSPEDVKPLEESFMEHMNLEIDSLRLGENILGTCSDFPLRHIMNHLITEERKHHDTMKELILYSIKPGPSYLCNF